MSSCAIGRPASTLARSGEGCPVLVDKCFERRRRPTTNRLDQVVRAGEDPVLVVDRDLAQVLDDERIARPAVWCLFKLAVQRSGVVSGRRLLPSGGHHLEHGLNAHLLVLDFFSKHAAENIGDPLIGELDRTVQRVRLAAVLTGVFHNPHDNARLILRGNWCMAAGGAKAKSSVSPRYVRRWQSPRRLYLATSLFFPSHVHGVDFDLVVEHAEVAPDRDQEKPIVLRPPATET